jgi:iron complex outermembrane receptor protein
VLVRPRFGLADESQFAIRGSGLQNNFHNRDVNFLFNGYIYGQADGFSDFESIELMDTKRVEVFKGANALRYGANSIGGAVNFVTKTGYDAAPIEYWGEAGSFGFFKQHIATGWVRGPFDLYGGFSAVGLEGYRDHAQQQRYRLNTSTGWDFGGGMTARFDVGWVRSLENLPGALTRGQFEANPRQRNPSTAFANEQRNYDYPNGAFTFRLPLAPNQELVSLTQLNYQDLNHPLSFAIIDQTTYNWSQELRYINSNALVGYRISSPRASSTSAPR